MDEEETPQHVIDNLVLELSLASALPISLYGRNYIQATSAANTLAYHTSTMKKKELRKLEYAVGPLLILLSMNIDDPVSAKAALGLRSLMPSRVCMSKFLELEGLVIVSNIFNALMGFNMVDMKSPSVHRSIIENCAVCYREIARFYPWKIVNINGLRHLVVMLRFGDLIIKTIAAGALAQCSADMDIVKQMFAYGAIKPLINAAEVAKTNEGIK